MSTLDLATTVQPVRASPHGRSRASGNPGSSVPPRARHSLRSALLGALIASACSPLEGSGPAWVSIPAGRFEMGSPADEPWRQEDEGPVHSVTLTRAFRMRATEVTQGEWSALMGENPSSLPGCGPTCPVNNVTLVEAIAFANALSRRDGLEPCYDRDLRLLSLDCRGYRLPTEAEWEYAARAGAPGMAPGGTVTSSTCAPLDPVLDRVAWYCGNSAVRYAGCWDLSELGGASCAGVQPVGLKEPNGFGLFDMQGNVWEWTNDSYAIHAFGAEPVVDPLGPPAGEQHVIRGGSWFYHAWTVRLARRYHLRADDPLHGNIGLRLVQTEPSL